MAAFILLMVLSGCSANAHLAAVRARVLIVSDSVAGATLTQDKNFTSTRRVIYVTVKAGSQPSSPKVAGTVPTAIYTSYATFEKDMAAGSLPTSVGAVMYDTEKWTQTPIVEQRDPRRYMAMFSRLASAHHLVPILAPGRDLALVPGASCVKRSGEILNQAFLRCGLVSADVRAKVLVIQSQVNEFDTAGFQRFVAAAAHQARVANPSIAVVAELATAPLGHAASVPQLVNAAHSVNGMVEGFALSARPRDTELAANLLASVTGN